MSKNLSLCHAPQITDEVINKAFEGTNFGRTDYREFLGYSVLQKACHWYCGHTITSIMVGLELITPKTHRLTKLGRMFLSDCYDDPMRIKTSSAAVPVIKPVKLPKERLTSEFEDEFFDRRIYLKDEVKAVLREAGIQIEGEE